MSSILPEFCTQAAGPEDGRQQAKEKPGDRAKVRHLLCTEGQTWPPKDPSAEELETLMPSPLRADWINSVKRRHRFQ